MPINVGITHVFQHIQTEITSHKLNSQNKNKKHHTHENIIFINEKKEHGYIMDKL